MDEFIGTIQMFAGNFAPQGWMFCPTATARILSCGSFNKKL